jgi:preprotein translocase subunit SecE
MSLDDLNREQKRQMRRMGALNEQGAPTRASARPRHHERVGPRQYLREVRDEMRKVAWPRKPEVVRYSIIVTATVIVYTAYVGTLDYIFGSVFAVVLRMSDQETTDMTDDDDRPRGDDPDETADGEDGAVARDRAIDAPITATPTLDGRFDEPTARGDRGRRRRRLPTWPRRSRGRDEPNPTVTAER